MADQADQGPKPKVFVSYSRRDASDFADELIAGLELAGFTAYLDRHDIAAGEDWEVRLGGLILSADSVVFVVTPAAVKSERCAWEVARTTALGKRLLPVVWKGVPETDIPEQLSRLQFVRFDLGQGLTRPLAQLAEALRRDIHWIREHTRQAELAARWEARGRPESLLLRGDTLETCNAWVQRRKPDAPEITPLQNAFFAASQQAEQARIGRERQQLEDMRRAQATTARFQRRAGRLLWGLSALMLAMLANLLWQSHDLASREIKVYTTLAATALKEGHFDRAMRYALQAYPPQGSLPWLTPFSSELEGKLAGGALLSPLHRTLKHTAALNAVEFSPDGMNVLTASRDSSATLWDAETGAHLFSFWGHDDSVINASFNQMANRIFTISSDYSARLWDPAQRKQLAALPHDGPVRSAAFSPDGARLITAAEDDKARLWDSDVGGLIAVLSGHNNSVWSAAFSADGNRVVTGSKDKTARLWNAQTGEQIAVLSGHDDIVWTVSFSPDGHRVVTGSGDATARLWNAATGKQIASLSGHTKSVRKALFSSDGIHIATASDDGTARIWDAQSGRQISVLSGHAGSIRALAFSPNGRHVATGSDDGTVRIWDAHVGRLLALFSGHTDSIRSVSFAPGGKWIVSGSADSSARIWNWSDGNAILSSRAPDKSVRRITLSPDLARILTISSGGSVRLADTKSGESISAHSEQMMQGAEFGPDGKMISPFSDNTARIWNAATGKVMTILAGHEAPVRTAILSADGRRAATSSADRTARIWDADTGRQLAILAGHKNALTGAWFNVHGTRLLTTASFEWEARLWDPDTSALLFKLGGHTDTVNHATFSPDGKRIVTASSDKSGILWDAGTGKRITSLLGHVGSLRLASFSPDSDRVVTAASDGTVRLWDAATGGEIAVLPVASHVVKAWFSRDAQQLVLLFSDNTWSVWDVRWATRLRGAALQDRVCREKLVGSAQEFTRAELKVPILSAMNPEDRVARNPCLRRGPLSLQYWTRLPTQLWTLLGGTG